MWRDAYTRSEEKQVTLRAIILELESKEVKADTDKAATPPVSQNLRKRKSLQRKGSEAPTTSVRKKAKTATTLTPHMDQDFLEHMKGMGQSKLDDSGRAIPPMSSFTTDDSGTAFLHHVFVLQQTFRTKIPMPKSLAAILCQTASGICQIISETGHQEPTPAIKAGRPRQHKELPSSQFQTVPEDSVETRLLAIRRIVPSLLAGLRRLSQLPNGPAFENQVVHCFVKIFRDTLERVCDLAVTNAVEYDIKNVSRTPSSRTRKRHSAKVSDTRQEGPCFACGTRGLSCDGHIPRCQNCIKLHRKCEFGTSKLRIATNAQNVQPEAPSRSISALCELAVSFIALVHAPDLAHEHVKEGCLFLLYDKVGQGLKAFVDESQYEDMSQEQAGNGLLHQKKGGTRDKGRNPVELLEASAPYFIWMLERTQTLVSAQHHPPIFSQQTKDRDTVALTVSTFRTSNEESIVDARKKLQHTLLKAVFDNDTCHKFEPSLTFPKPTAASDIPKTDVAKAGVRDWFKQEVWRIVGWDVLAEHVKWEDD